MRTGCETRQANREWCVRQRTAGGNACVWLRAPTSKSSRRAPCGLQPKPNPSRFRLRVESHRLAPRRLDIETKHETRAPRL